MKLSSLCPFLSGSDSLLNSHDSKSDLYRSLLYERKGEREKERILEKKMGKGGQVEREISE